VAQRRFGCGSDKEGAAVTEIAVDSNVFVSALLKGEEHYDKAVKFVEGLRLGEYLFHISMLVPVEVCGVILRRTGSLGRAYLARREMEGLTKQGYVKLYPLDDERMTKAEGIALRDRLKGHDAVIAEVAEELELAILTFDKEVSKRFRGTKL
jgi:predicted nucleic acid-binding protein